MLLSAAPGRGDGLVPTLSQPPPCHSSCRQAFGRVCGPSASPALSSLVGLQWSWGLRCSLTLAKGRLDSLLLGVTCPCLWTGGDGSAGTVVGTVTVWELGGDGAWPLLGSMKILDVCYH